MKRRPTFYPRSSMKQLFTELKKNNDFVCYEHDSNIEPFIICYFFPLIDSEILHRDLLEKVREPFATLEELQARLPFEQIVITDEPKVVKEKLFGGYVRISIMKEEERCLLIKCLKIEGRDVTAAEIEFSVEGPKEAFTESYQTNLNLIRKRLPTLDLQMKEIKVGKQSHTKVAVMYLGDKAHSEDVDLVFSRLRQIEFDGVLDSSFIQQVLQDNWKSPFPQLKETERPDRVCGQLQEGRLVIIVDGSPFVLCGPVSFVDFFSSMEDYYLSWQVGTAFRLIRYFAVTFSVLATPLYVAVLTYHYQLIPRDLLGTLIGSRANIPFPPIIEALFLELTIELLREAGARLPTKVGQTLGIVGGIVIGQASVEAGLTSNVLLIIVALAALASFTTPVYRMGNTIRLLRFPFLIFAGMWGLLGVMVCSAFVLTHLIRLTSLNRPYLEPIYPPRLKRWRDVFVRFPYMPVSAQKTKKSSIFSGLRFKHQKDIDE
ncbi:spore germination protein [Bacillus tianshenii]|nr:spore germination protein [Bacillus tianshenii]